MMSPKWAVEIARGLSGATPPVICVCVTRSRPRRGRSTYPRTDRDHCEAILRQTTWFLENQMTILAQACLPRRRVRPIAVAMTLLLAARSPEQPGKSLAADEQAKPAPAVRSPLVRVVDLDVGESQIVNLCNGRKVSVKLTG